MTPNHWYLPRTNELFLMLSVPFSSASLAHSDLVLSKLDTFGFLTLCLPQPDLVYSIDGYCFSRQTAMLQDFDFWLLCFRGEQNQVVNAAENQQINKSRECLFILYIGSGWLGAAARDVYRPPIHSGRAGDLWAHGCHLQYDTQHGKG